MSGSVLDNVTWKGNSKKMYKTILEAVPSMFKSTIKHQVEDWLIKNKVDVVTEVLVIKMFKEKAPKGIWDKVSPKLESMKTHSENPKLEPIKTEKEDPKLESVKTQKESLKSETMKAEKENPNSEDVKKHKKNHRAGNKKTQKENT